MTACEVDAEKETRLGHVFSKVSAKSCHEFWFDIRHVWGGEWGVQKEKVGFPIKPFAEMSKCIKFVYLHRKICALNWHRGHPKNTHTHTCTHSRLHTHRRVIVCKTYKIYTSLANNNKSTLLHIQMRAFNRDQKEWPPICQEPMLQWQM